MFNTSAQKTLSLDRSSSVSEHSLHNRVILPSQLLTSAERADFEDRSNNHVFFRSFREDGLLCRYTNFLRHESMKTLPDLLSQEPSQKMPIISYCCSTGEEPYTLHLLLRARYGSDYNTRFPISAYDLDEYVLETAKLGEISCHRVNDQQLLAELRNDANFAQSLGLKFYVTNDDMRMQAKVPDFHKVTFEKRDITLDPLEFDTPVAIFIQNAIYHLQFNAQFALMDKLCALPSDSLLYLGGDSITDRLIAEILPRTNAFSTATQFPNVLKRR